MYKHLLVPVDDTDLSTANVAEALKLARRLGPEVKVTFFHATADYAASGEGSRVQALHHDRLHRFPLFAEGTASRVREMSAAEVHAHALGQSRTILAKACAAAVAAQVPYDTHSVASDRPADAIVQAAHDCGCDLIVMASHGASGLRALLSPSQTTRVMRNAGMPLLVTHVQANDRHALAGHACALIQDEHRSLGAVVVTMQRRLAEARSGAEGLDHEAFGRMLRYIHDFPEQRHHPREQSSLHRLLLARTERGNALVQTLEAQHLTEHELVAALQAAWQACTAGAHGADAALAQLDDALAALADHVREHLQLEEQQLMPLALEVLKDDDWKEVAAAFEGADPGYGEWTDMEFRRHFTNIANTMKLPQAGRDSKPAP
jgi:nucleotide-binding universal stress UspA family protein/hemerythrin-like domain-containing protein